MRHLERSVPVQLVQQALQTGPCLNFGKPAQFKRMHKVLQAERVTHTLGHPHVRAVRRLLDALALLLPPTMSASASTPIDGDGGDDGGNTGENESNEGLLSPTNPEAAVVAPPESSPAVVSVAAASSFAGASPVADTAAQQSGWRLPFGVLALCLSGLGVKTKLEYTRYKKSHLL